VNNRKLILLAAIVGLACELTIWEAHPAVAQTPAPQTAADAAPTIRAQTRLVLVDAVVTDKKGNYIHDLTAKDFRVWEDNKEQAIKAISLESGGPDPLRSQKHYLVLFFDNSTMSAGDQVRARQAAAKFLQANSGPNHLIAVVDFGGTTHITQNFTADPVRLQKAVAGIKGTSVFPDSAPPVEIASLGMPNLSHVEADFAARTVMLALKDLAKSLSTVPGRKTLVMLTAGFPLNAERESELPAVINACNKANVAVYPIDVRGLIASVHSPDQPSREAAGEFAVMPAYSSAPNAPSGTPHLVYVAWQRSPGDGGGGRGPGGGGGGPVGGGGGGGRVGGGGGGGRTGGGGGGGGKTGGGGSGGGKTGGGPGGGRVGGSTPLPYYTSNPYTQPRIIVPQWQHPDYGANDQFLYALAEGTGGFVIHDSNDLLAGLKRISKDQDQYYILAYTPPESAEGSCHALKVKVDRGGTVIRSRSGYCNTKPVDLLAGKIEGRDLEARVSGQQPGDMSASVQVPYFYVAANVARVDLAMELPTANIKFEKLKGKQHADVNVLGIAYKPDGTVAGRFSDTVNLDLDGKKEVEEFAKHPLRYENQFELASGQYTLKVAFNAGPQSFGKVEVPLNIETYDAKQFSASTLALSNELRRVSDMATGLDAELLADRTPLVVQGVQMVPSGANRFKTSDTAAVYFEVYAPLLVSDKPPKIALQYGVIDRKTGERKLDTSITNTEKAVQAGSPVVPIGLKLPVSDLGPGTYRVEIRALDMAGNSSPIRYADFVVQ